jgi:Mg-chelatase subunit ChlD
MAIVKKAGSSGGIDLSSEGGLIRRLQEKIVLPTRHLIPKGIAILIVDCSGSMAGDKLQNTIEGCIGFARDAIAEEYAVGVISFSDTWSCVQRPTREVNEVGAAVHSLSAGGMTLLAGAVNEAHEQLRLPVRLKAIVVFTDGYVGDSAESISAIQALKRDGVDVIAMGTEGADRRFLKTIASRSELAVETTTKQISGAIRSAARLLSS